MFVFFNIYVKTFVLNIVIFPSTFFPDALDLRLPTNGDINPHHRYLLVQPPQLSSRPFPFTDSSTAAVPTKQHSPTLSIEQRLADLTNARRHPGIPVPASTAGSPLPGRPSSADVPSSAVPLTLTVPKLHTNTASPRLRPEMAPLTIGDVSPTKAAGYRFQGEISSYDIPSPPSNGKLRALWK